MTTALLKISKQEIAPLTFDALVARVRETLAAGRARAALAVDRERSRTYWETGRWIHIYKLKGKDRAKYGEKLFLRLEEMLDLSESLLRDMLSCYRLFPIPHARGELTWRDYQALIRIKDEKTRQADVFYLPVESPAPRGYDREKVLAEGRFLNQELLDLGLARRV